MSKPIEGLTLQEQATMRAEIASEKLAIITAAGHPTIGQHITGEVARTQNGEMWQCSISGTPGDWVGSHETKAHDSALLAPRCDYNATRMYPGMVSGNLYMHPGRLYAVTYPLDDKAGLSQLLMHVYTAGEAGCTIKAGIYDDYRGRPGKLVATSNAVAADTTGAKSLILDVTVAGGQWIWIAIVAQNCPSTQPIVGKIVYSPYSAQYKIATIDAGYENRFAPYAAGITGMLPNRWPYESTFTIVNTESPTFGMYFTGPPSRTIGPDRYPVMLPNASEEFIALEPNVGYFPSRPEAERYVLFYTIGWLTPSTAWATAPTIDGPWTRRGTFNAAGRGFLFVDPLDDEIYFYSAGSPLKCHHGSTVEEMVASSPVNVMTASQAANPNMTGIYQNTTVIRESVGNYTMLFDALDSVIAPSIWQAGRATATSPLGPWTVTHWPLTSLRQTIADGNNFGLIGHTSAGHLHKNGPGDYSLWYHAADYGNLPGEIFKAQSTDGITWVPDDVWAIRRDHKLEWDQVADPFFFTDPVGGLSYVFWSAMNNEIPYAAVMRSNPSILPVTWT